MTSPTLWPSGDARWWCRALPFAVILLVTCVLVWPIVWGGVRLGQDTATQFYPWYWLLGEGLRHGRIPEWNAYQFSGAPMIGDPQSGWGYVLPMLAFTLLPLTGAVWVQIFGHLLLANLGMYLFGRRLGLSVGAALVAGLALAGSGIVYGRIPSGPASYQAVTWLPWILLGVEIALQARTWKGRGGGWLLTAFAVSQSLAAWVGQLSYYTALLLGAYLLYRTFWSERDVADTRLRPAWLAQAFRPVLPLDGPARWRPRGGWPALVGLVVNGAIIGGFGVGLAALGLLPKLEFNKLSSASGGNYNAPGGEAVGGSSGDTVARFFEPSVYYPIAAVIVLAVAGLFLARWRFGFAFWLIVTVAGGILTLPIRTPLHLVLYLIPGFEMLHRHYPERISMALMPGLAMMAGAGADAVIGGAGRARPALPRLGAVVVPAAILVLLIALGGSVSPIVLATTTLTLVLIAVAVLVPGVGVVRGRRPTAVVMGLAAAVLLVVFADAWLMNRALVAVAPFGGFHNRNLERYYAPSPAARFLQQRMAEDGPFRFAGYDPDVYVIEHGLPTLYRYQFADPLMRELVVNNRAIMQGLDDVQGYNPLQLESYVSLISIMNGAPQEYHNAAVLPGGLTSPLLNLINLRYLIVPVSTLQRSDVAALAAQWPTVYMDGTVHILQNPRALPRAWLVQQATTVPADAALPAINSGQIDPRRVAVFEAGNGGAAPALPAASDSIGGTATVARQDDPDRMAISVSAPSRSILVMSEIAYPAWHVEVDGRPATMLTVDHLLRGVVVPAGDHQVRLVYDSPATRWGIRLTGATAIVIVLGMLAAVWMDRRLAEAARRDSQHVVAAPVPAPRRVSQVAKSAEHA